MWTDVFQFFIMVSGMVAILIKVCIANIQMLYLTFSVIKDLYAEPGICKQLYFTFMLHLYIVSLWCDFVSIHDVQNVYLYLYCIHG